MEKSISKIKNKDEIKKATKYSDLFSDDKEVAKHQFRDYCKLYHPDVDNSEQAKKLFDIIQKFYTTNSIKSVHYQTVKETITFKNKKTGKGFEISNPVILNNGICSIYHTLTKIVFEYHMSYKKFFDNFLKINSSFKYANADMEEQFKRLFPRIVKSFETDRGTLCILMDKTNEVLNLGRIVRAYTNNKEKFPEKQAAWILNRLYNIACYVNYNGLVFNGFTLDNLWVSPEMHTVLPLSGWEYTTKQGQDMIGVPKDVYKLLPIKVKDSKQSDIITDLESIKQIGRILYKDHTDLKPIQEFLKQGVKEADPLTEWQLYGEAVKSVFGKRKFIVWENVPYNG